MGRGGEEIPVAQIRLEKVNALRPCSSPWEKPRGRNRKEAVLTFGERGPRREAQGGHLRRPAPHPYE